MGVEKRENGRIRKQSDKKRERKEKENYKTENGRKLVMKERGKRRKEKERYREKSCGVKIYIFVTNKSLISRRVLNYLIKCKKEKYSKRN